MRPGALPVLVLGLLTQACFTFNVPPEIESVEESICVYEEITILGENFGNYPVGGGVFLSLPTGVQALNVVAWSDTEISASIPQEAGGVDGEVFVRTAEGESESVPVSIRMPGLTGTSDLPCAGEVMTLFGECLGNEESFVQVLNDETQDLLTLGESDEDSIEVQLADDSVSMPIKVRVTQGSLLFDSEAYDFVLSGTPEPFDRSSSWKLHHDADGGRHIVFREEDGPAKHTYEVKQGCWSFPEVITILDSDDVYGSYSHGDEYIHVTYGSSTDSECWYTRYDTSTIAWSEAILLSNLECRGAPEIEKGPDGKLLAYWHWGSIKLALLDEETGAWGETRTVNWAGCEGSEVYPPDGGCKAWYPQLRFGVDGSLLAMFGRGMPADTDGNVVKFSRSLDDGLSWSIPHVIGPGGPSGKMLVDGEGVIHVVYPYSPSTDNYVLMYTTSDTNGRSWEDDHQFDDTAYGAYQGAGMVMSEDGSSIAIDFVEKSYDEETDSWPSGDRRYYLWREGEGWSDEASLLELQCPDGGWESFRLTGIENDGALRYATIGDPALYDDFLVETGIERTVLDTGMAYVPGGCASIGSEEGAGSTDEHPRHDVLLSPYYIDLHEVTNLEYRGCVDAGACTPPRNTGSRLRTNYFNVLDDYPVLYVTWAQAYEYCAWAGKRLPTEAEWEKAAAGARGRDYPWGDCEGLTPAGWDCCLRCDHANGYFWNLVEGPLCAGREECDCDTACVGDTVAVGSYDLGVSPVGAYDMAGNVAEWVYDYYAADYYMASPSADPRGPLEGYTRVVRGGSCLNHPNDVRTAVRAYHNPEDSTDTLGFRCVLPVDL